MQPPADDAEIVAAARARQLGEDWDLAVCLADLLLEADRRPVVAHASPVHGMAVLSLPDLGVVGPRRRALQITLGLVRALLGNGEATDPARLAHAGHHSAVSEWLNRQVASVLAAKPATISLLTTGVGTTNTLPRCPSAVAGHR